MQHLDIFINLFGEYNLTQKAIAAESDIEESKLSRFLRNGKDLRAGEFFRLLEAMPEKFQKEFWAKFRDEKIDLSHIVAGLSNYEYAELLRLLADRYQFSEAGKQRASSKSNEEKGKAAIGTA